MDRQLFIGCDIGTSSTKAVAADVHGTIHAQASVSYGLSKPRGNWAEQHPDVWLDAAVSAIRAVTGHLPSTDTIEAVCISALYGGTGAMCDGDMVPVRPSIIWMDRRAEDESRELRALIGEEDIFRTSGNGIDSYFGYTKLLWVRKHEPSAWARIRHIVPIHSYIICKMTGELAVDYCSAGNVGGIYNYERHTWSQDMCCRLGIPFASLPSRFCKPEEIVGTLNKEYQEKLGIGRPVPFCAGTVDCIASMLSAGITKPGDNAAVLGTSLNWGFIHRTKPGNPNLISMPYCIEPDAMSYTYGGASTAGALPRWFAQNFLGQDSSSSYELLEKEVRDAKAGPGSDGLIALPYFMGERTPIWDENATGVLFGLTLSHTRAHIYRAVLESVAYSLRHIMECMTGPMSDISKIVLVGGGARSGLWKEIFADVTGLPVYTPVQDAEAPLGDAFLAAIGSGQISDYSLIERWIAMDIPIRPNLSHHEQYSRYYALYKELYHDLKETMKKRADLLRK